MLEKIRKSYNAFQNLVSKAFNFLAIAIMVSCTIIGAILIAINIVAFIVNNFIIRQNINLDFGKIGIGILVFLTIGLIVFKLKRKRKEDPFDKRK